jgi:hypothetical protein
MKSSARNLKSRIDPHIANDPDRACETDPLAADYRSSSFDKFSAQQDVPLKAGSTRMTSMHEERASRKRGWSAWKRQLNT